MGNITNVTIRNDALGYIQNNPKEFVDGVINAIGSCNTQTIPIGPYCNYVTVHKSRHMSENTLYVQYSNCVMEVSPYSKDYLELIKKNPIFAKRMVDFLSTTLKEVKNVMKENKDE